MAILLLSTEACHLCELAENILQQTFNQSDVIALSQQFNFQIYSQDIIDQQSLLDQYAEKIPILLDESSNLTLEWPFSVADVSVWLEKVARNTGPSSA